MSMLSVERTLGQTLSALIDFALSTTTQSDSAHVSNPTAGKAVTFVNP